MKSQPKSITSLSSSRSLLSSKSTGHKSHHSSVITQQPSNKNKSGQNVIPGQSKTSKKISLINQFAVLQPIGGVGSYKQNIFGGSLYSKALLRGQRDDDDIRSELRNESLRFLEGTRRLFFRKCATFPPELSSFKPKHKRGIWNAFGRVLYYTGQKKGFTCKDCHYSGFIHEVVDYSGKTVIIANGRQFLFGLNSFVEISLEGGKLLGTMRQSCLSSVYEIKDSSGRLVYKIQAPCYAPCAPFVFWCCKENFELCMDDGVTEIGKITKNWGSSVEVSEFRNCPGIEMERVDDVRVKALLLGCFFLIEFQYFRHGGNGYLYFIILILIFAAIVVAFECAGYCPLWMDHVFTKIDIIK